MQPNFYVFENLSIAYFTQGNPQHPCLFLVHGFCEDHHIWQNITTHFSQKYFVVMPNLLGFGYSPVSPKFSMEYIAQSLHALLQHLTIQKVIYIGHSLGGYIGLAFAEQYPQFLKGFLLLHSTALADTPEKKQTRQNTIRYLQQYGSNNGFLNAFFANFFSPQFTQNFPQVVNKFKDIALLYNPQALIHATQAMQARPARSTVLNSPHFKVGFVAGKLDTLVPYTQTINEIMAVYNPVFLSIIPHAAHASTIETPEAAIQKIDDFCDFCNL